MALYTSRLRSSVIAFNCKKNSPLLGLGKISVLEILLFSIYPLLIPTLQREGLETIGI